MVNSRWTSYNSYHQQWPSTWPYYKWDRGHTSWHSQKVSVHLAGCTRHPSTQWTQNHTIHYHAGLDGHLSVTRHTYTHNTSREPKTSSWIPFHGISKGQTRHSQKYQPYPITIDSGIVLCQTAAQERYLLYIIASVGLNASNGIAKATATKQSGNWYRWCTLLKHSGIAD